MNIPRHLRVVNFHVRTGTMSFQCRLMKRSQNTKRVAHTPEKTSRQIVAGEDQAHMMSAPCNTVTNMIESPRKRMAPKGSSCLKEDHEVRVSRETVL